MYIVYIDIIYIYLNKHSFSKYHEKKEIETNEQTLTLQIEVTFVIRLNVNFENRASKVKFHQ